MSVQHWATTTLVVLLAGAGLCALAPDPAAWSAVLADPQRVVDTAGPDALLVPVAWALAAACWAWGALGLLLTVASCGPRPVARVAVPLLHLLVPAALRRAAAVAVGLSLAAAPVLAVPAGPSLAVAAVHQVAPTDDPALDDPALDDPAADDPGTGPAPADAAGDLPPVPDWPAPVPDWPAPAPTGSHVVVRGDCLWDIAAGRLAERGAEVDDAAVAAAVQAWWRVNAAVIGPDPDLLLPGQVLRAP